MIKFNCIVCCTLLLLSACNTQNAEQPSSDTTLSGKLVITGSSTIAPMAGELAREFEKQNTGVKIDVQAGGSSRGMTDVRQGTSNIGMVSRHLRTKEKDLTPHLLAIDGVSIIVHKDNPIEELSEQQIIAIYRGELTNWKTLNGSDKKITVINKAEGRSTLEVFLKYFKLKNSQIKPDIIIGDNEQGIKLVSKNKESIAYVSIGTSSYDIALGIPIKTLPLNGVAANIDTLRNNEFPLSRELNFVTKGEISKLAKSFIAFSQSQAAFSIVKDFGFVPSHSR